MAKLRVGYRAVAISAALFAAVACDAITPLDASLGASVITREPPDDIYGLTVSDGVVTAAAPSSNTGGNMRVVFWRAADAATTDQESCATWTAADQNQQPGIALRAHQIDTGVRVITVTKNVWLAGYSIFNVHVMDSNNALEPYVQIGGQDLAGLRNSPFLYDVKPYPWRSCARVVGSILSLKVWPTAEPEPAWNDPSYGYSVTLPDGWGDPGRPGSYIGHLPPGGSLQHSDLTVSDLTITSAAAPRRRSEPTTSPLAPTHILRAP